MQLPYRVLPPLHAAKQRLDLLEIGVERIDLGQRARRLSVFRRQPGVQKIFLAVPRLAHEGDQPVQDALQRIRFVRRHVRYGVRRRNIGDQSIQDGGAAVHIGGEFTQFVFELLLRHVHDHGRHIVRNVHHVFGQMRQLRVKVVVEEFQARRQALRHHLDYARRIYPIHQRIEVAVAHIHGGGALVFVYARDNVLREVQHAVKVLGGQVEHQPQAARRAFGEPDVRHRRGKLNVSHSLAAHLGARHLHPAPIAGDAPMPYLLVLAAVALPVLRRPEDLLAEQPVLFGTQRAVVDGLRLHHLAVRPELYLFGGSKGNLYRVEVVAALSHKVAPPL